MALIEAVGDPLFDDSSSWVISGSGASVTGGELRCVNASVASAHPAHWYKPSVGDVYVCEVIITTGLTGSTLNANWNFGGVSIWNWSVDGTTAGTYSKTITVTSRAGLSYVGINTGVIGFGSVSVKRKSTVSNMEIDNPPFIIKHFDHHWKNWLNELFEKLRGPLWEDNTSDLSTGGVAAGSPALTTFNSGPYKAYVFANGDSVLAAFHIKHDIKPNSKIYPHVHWTTDGTNAGSVTWRIHYQYAKGHNQEPFSASAYIDITDTASGTAWQHMITEASDTQAILAPEVDSLILVACELETSSGFGTPADDIFGLYVDLHYQKDRFGTPQKNPRDIAGNLTGFYRRTP